MTSKTIRANNVLLVLRVALSGIIAAHGWSRLIADAVTPFGAWLDSLGFPLGIVIAWGVTLIEIIGTPLLLLGWMVSPLCLTYTLIYLCGLVLVHAPEGWFVVGLGRNGMEYSALLIVCLLGLAYQHWPKSRRNQGKGRSENVR